MVFWTVDARGRLDVLLGMKPPLLGIAAGQVANHSHNHNLCSAQLVQDIVIHYHASLTATR